MRAHTSKILCRPIYFEQSSIDGGNRRSSTVKFDILCIFNRGRRTINESGLQHGEGGHRQLAEGIHD